MGDLWSYNSERNEFVVSPDPDVRVIPIDAKKFRCLIFGTDGLWNVVTPQNAVNMVRDKEMINGRLYAQKMNDKHKKNNNNINTNASRTNEKISSDDGVQWANPSKSLVDLALRSWSTRKMRADNTSVVTVILYPPGQGYYNESNQSSNNNTQINNNIINISINNNSNIILANNINDNNSSKISKKLLRKKLREKPPAVSTDGTTIVWNGRNRLYSNINEQCFTAEKERNILKNNVNNTEEKEDESGDEEFDDIDEEEEVHNVEFDFQDDKIVNYNDNISYKEMVMKYAPPEEYRHFHYCASNNQYGFLSGNVASNNYNINARNRMPNGKEIDVNLDDFTVLADDQMFNYNHYDHYYHQQPQQEQQNNHQLQQHNLLQEQNNRQGHIQPQHTSTFTQFNLPQQHLVSALNKIDLSLDVDPEYYDMTLSHSSWSGNSIHQNWTSLDIVDGRNLLIPLMSNNEQESNESSDDTANKVKRSILTISGLDESGDTENMEIEDEEAICVINYKNYLPSSEGNIFFNLYFPII